MTPTSSTNETAAAAPTPRPVLLLVEDEDDVRGAAAVWLDAQGFDVRAVAGGAEAIEEVSRAEPDIIVLDLMMPGTNGWDVWDWLQGRTRPIPVVVWTGSGLRTGAVGQAPIVSKGNPEDLIGALRVVFNPRSRG